MTEEITKKQCKHCSEPIQWNDVFGWHHGDMAGGWNTSCADDENRAEPKLYLSDTLRTTVGYKWAYWLDLRNNLAEMSGRWKRAQRELHHDLGIIWHDLYGRGKDK